MTNYFEKTKSGDLTCLQPTKSYFISTRYGKQVVSWNKGVATMVHATRGQLWHLKILWHLHLVHMQVGIYHRGQYS